MVRNARVNTKGSLVENEGYAGEMNLLHIRGVLTAQWPLARFCAKKKQVRILSVFRDRHLHNGSSLDDS